MRNKATARLAAIFSKLPLVEIDRSPVDDYKLTGYVVGISEKLILLHLLQDQVMRLNGYVVVRRSDVKKNYRIFGEDTHFIPRVLPLLGEKPVLQPDLDITSIRSLLASARLQFSLIGIECEKAEPGMLFIGTVEKLSSKTVWLRRINTAGHQMVPDDFKLKNITKVVLGDGYQEALAFLVQHEANAAVNGENP